nr:hypothetical protein [Colwellia sp.]
MKKVWYCVVIVCGCIGLCMSIIGLILVPNQALLYLNAIFFCCVGILLGISKILRKENDKPTRQLNNIINLLTSFAMLSTGTFILFTSDSVFTQLVSVSGILLFGYGLFKLLKKTKASREKEIILSLDYESAFEKSWKALKSINAEVNKNNAEGFIFARTGRSWRSGGEELIVNLQSLNKSQTHIKIISEPMPSRAII